MLHFLDGLGYAIHIAAFEGESLDNLQSLSQVDLDLDVKASPRSKKPSLDIFDETNTITQLSASVDDRSIEQTKLFANDITEALNNCLFKEETVSSLKPMTIFTESDLNEYIFPITQIEPLNSIPNNLTMDKFTDIKHITDGSNANISIAKYNEMKVIIKMIKETSQYEFTVIHEFDIELQILNRISHPNIIKLIGSGQLPRRFIVLEYLEGGTLNTILSKNQQKSGFANKIFRKPSFTYVSLLERSLEIANAMNYLHSQFNEHAMIIHRGTLIFNKFSLSFLSDLLNSLLLILSFIQCSK